MLPWRAFSLLFVWLSLKLCVLKTVDISMGEALRLGAFTVAVYLGYLLGNSLGAP